MGRINARWHSYHPMPKNPTKAERVEWHARHSEMCGCRPIPPHLAAEVAALTTRKPRRPAN